MPMLALVAILSASATQHINHAVATEDDSVGAALPEATAIVHKFRPAMFKAKAFHALARPKKAHLN
jgi:hypothetical protein